MFPAVCFFLILARKPNCEMSVHQGVLLKIDTADFDYAFFSVLFPRAPLPFLWQKKLVSSSLFFVLKFSCSCSVNSETTRLKVKGCDLVRLLVHYFITCPWFDLDHVGSGVTGEDSMGQSLIDNLARCSREGEEGGREGGIERRRTCCVPMRRWMRM